MQESRSFFIHVPQLLRKLKNLDAWEEAKREIEKIPPHPNKAPPGPEKLQDVNSSDGRNVTAIVNGR